MTGLSEAQMASILRVIRAFPQVHGAILFGSRALGTWKPTSDIDLALSGPALTLLDEARIASALEDLCLPLQIDLVRLEHIDSPELREHIERHGIPL